MWYVTCTRTQIHGMTWDSMQALQSGIPLLKNHGDNCSLSKHFLKLTFLQPPLYVLCCIHLSWLPQCYFLWSEAPNSKGTAGHTLHSCCHSLKLFCLISVIFKIEHYLPRMAACWTVKTNSFFPLASSLLRLSPSTIYF